MHGVGTILRPLGNGEVDLPSMGRIPASAELSGTVSMVFDGLPPSERLTWTVDSLAVTSSVADGASPLQPGQWVGRYLLLEPLGYGAQGAVWRAVQGDPVVREVALKLLVGSELRAPRRLSRLKHEAERGQRLNAEAFLPAYEFGVVRDVAFMAMPLVCGCTLRDVINARRRRPSHRGSTHPFCFLGRESYLRAILRIMLTIARSLDVAHRARVAHRDIKPSNILLDSQDASKGYLIDFGLARDLDIATLPQLRDGSGTPLYMAPEKLQSRQLDEFRCDVFALGVTLYEAVTLMSPIPVPRGLTGVALMAYLAVHRPARPRPPKPALVTPLEAVLYRAMAADPLDRYPTAGALADDLERVLAIRTALTRPRCSRGSDSEDAA